MLGTGIGGMDTIAERVVPLVNEKKSKRLGSTAVEQVMASGISARVSGILALGNQVTTNSSACARASRRSPRAPGASAPGARSACCAAAPRCRARTSGRASTRCACCAASSTTQPEKASRPHVGERRRLHPGLRRGRARAREPRVRAGARRAHPRRGARRGDQLRRPPRRRQHDGAEPDRRAALHPGGARRRRARAGARRRDQRAPHRDRRRPEGGRQLVARARPRPRPTSP